MDFSLSEIQEMIRDTARDFAEKELGPIAAEIDAESRFPGEVVAKMGELGLMGIYIPEEGFGIRLENDIVVTEDGPIDLMADIPIEADQIETLMNR